jgi:hypothetical protein
MGECGLSDGSSCSRHGEEEYKNVSSREYVELIGGVMMDGACACCGLKLRERN